MRRPNVSDGIAALMNDRRVSISSSRIVREERADLRCSASGHVFTVGGANPARSQGSDRAYISHNRQMDQKRLFGTTRLSLVLSILLFRNTINSGKNGCNQSGICPTATLFAAGHHPAWFETCTSPAILQEGRNR